MERKLGASQAQSQQRDSINGINGGSGSHTASPVVPSSPLSIHSHHSHRGSDHGSNGNGSQRDATASPSSLMITNHPTDDSVTITARLPNGDTRLVTAHLRMKT
jgi:hypothetical protein